MNYRMANNMTLWIPIVFLFLFLSNRKAFIEFSHGILGKLISVCLILYYASFDMYIGTAVCLLVILYYQSDTVESMLNILDSSPYPPHQTHKNTAAVDEFRKENCAENVLKYKNMDVKPAIAEHVFPSLQFTNESCNPCLKTCAFSIIESKLQTENAMIPTMTI